MDEVASSLPRSMDLSEPGVEPTTASDQLKTSVKRFTFRSKGSDFEKSTELTVLIPERLEASYGLYVWPSAHLLSWYIFEHRQTLLKNKKVLEIGCGTALPGIVASLCGAEVTLSDSSKLPHCLEQARKSVEANCLGDRVKVIGITWGFFLSDFLKIAKGQLDLIIGSDCFYDPSVFDDLLCTISYLLDHNPNAKFLCSYQERSSDWSIVSLLKKWDLECKQILFHELAYSCQIDLGQLLQGHTIQLLEITFKRSS